MDERPRKISMEVLLAVVFTAMIIVTVICSIAGAP